MVDYSKTAVAEIRDFIWSEIQEAGILNRNDYIADGFNKPLNPIIPVQQVPEFNNLMSGKTHIVYDFMVKTYSEDFWMCEEEMSLYIYSPDYSKILQITNFLLDTFRRMDLTAKDVNLSRANNSKFKYHYFYLDAAESPSPVDEEGGNHMGYVSIAYKYSREIGSDGKFL